LTVVGPVKVDFHQESGERLSFPVSPPIVEKSPEETSKRNSFKFSSKGKKLRTHIAIFLSCTLKEHDDSWPAIINILIRLTH
jgi:hypothetical protein